MRFNHRMKEITWTSKDKIYELAVWLEKGEIKGELYNKDIGKRYTLDEALSYESDSATFFPQEVNESLHRLVQETNKK